MNKIKQLKKVKIDEHIKNSKKAENKAPIKKRGRPKKEPQSNIEVISTGESGIHQGSSFGDGPSNSIVNEGIESNIVQPVYDTTEQAKAFIKTPFEVSAMIFSEPRLTLYPEELDAIMPSWKVVFDKHIVPNLGENADVYLFATVMLGITAKKYSIIASKPKDGKIKEMQVSQPKQESQNESYINPPGIPTMPVFGGNA